MLGADTLVSMLPVTSAEEEIPSTPPRLIPREQALPPYSWYVPVPALRADVESLEHWLDLNA